MQLVIVDNKDDEWFHRQYRIMQYVDYAIERANKLITRYMSWSHDKTRISVHKNQDDYWALQNLLKTLESGFCEEIFNTINTDMSHNLPDNLSDFPIGEIKDLLTSMLRASTIQQFNKNLTKFIAVASHKGQSDEYGHLFTFIAYN